jgi:FkbM family methyltransferase
MRWIYFHVWPFFLPRNRMKVFSVSKIKVSFYINDLLTLNMVESKFFSKGPGAEIKILKFILNYLKSGEVSYDIGANVGVYTTFMAKKVGENGLVVAFEPEINNFRYLKKNIEINNLNNVIAYPIALGDESHDGILYGEGPCSRILTSRRDLNGRNVKIIPGDKLVINDEIPLPRVVKIDVEGYEYFVIKGLKETLSNKECQLVCCEIHPDLLSDDCDYRIIVELLMSIGFIYFETYPRDKEFHLVCYKD